MKILTATSPGHDGRPNEDFVGDVPGAVVLLDGAGIRGTDAVCHHGVAWYSHTLGATLLGRLARDGGRDLVSALADSIVEVAGRHRHTCDIGSPISPQSTVAMIRFADDRADFLVLADAYVVLDMVDARPRVVTDIREVSVRRECTAALNGLLPGTREYEQTEQFVIDALRARRNQPGGYWIAKDDPTAATQAVTGSVPLGQLNGAALLSNGASRIVDPYNSPTGRPSWSGSTRMALTRSFDRSAKRRKSSLAHFQASASPTTRRLPTANLPHQQRVHFGPEFFLDPDSGRPRQCRCVGSGEQGSKRFSARPVDVRRVGPLPVILHHRSPLGWSGRLAVRNVQVGEFLD